MSKPLTTPCALLVDGDPVQRGTLAAHLELLGFAVAMASDAGEVQRLAAAGAGCIAITEWSLPGIEGLSLARALEPQKRPVILFTHRDVKALPAEAAQCGFELMLCKNRRADLLAYCRNRIGLDPAPSQPQAAGAAVPAGASSLYAGKQLLLVEDSATVRGFVRRLLENAMPGLVVRESEDGKSAIREMSHGKVDCIITDLQMPGMDGWAFLKTIRQNPLLKTKPVIVFSSVIKPELIEHYRDDTHIRFLDKPSVGEQISRTVREMMAA